MFQMMSSDSSNIPGLDTILQGEIMRKDALINQLVGQNKVDIRKQKKIESFIAHDWSVVTYPIFDLEKYLTFLMQELMAAKDRQDIELTAQRETIQAGFCVIHHLH